MKSYLKMMINRTNQWDLYLVSESYPLEIILKGKQIQTLTDVL